MFPSCDHCFTYVWSKHRYVLVSGIRPRRRDINISKYPTKWILYPVSLFLRSFGLCRGCILTQFFCCSFIPRAVDAELTESTIASGFTDLPMSEDHWKKVAKAFHLPGHFTKVATRRLTSIITICRTCEFSQVREKLWMHTFTINPKSHQAFAVAATHFESCEFTFSIMVGCTDDQINNVKRLVAGWQDASGHPLLMLGICAELELNRLENLIGKQRLAYQGLMEKIEDDAVSVGHDRFSWELIKEVRSIRDESKTVEEETETTKLQLSKAILPGIKTLLDQYANNRETFVEITNLFSERFNDILSRLDGLSAKCRIYVEGISFTTDIVSLPS